MSIADRIVGRAARPRIAALGLVIVLAGCGGRTEIAFEGETYRASVSRGETRAAFGVTVRRVSDGLDGAVQAGEYEAIRYCIENFGSSRIAWDVGPQTPRAALPVEGDALSMRGACDPL